jgi:hypothetical protein
VGDIYPPGPLEGKKALRKAQAHYFARPSLRGPGEELSAERINTKTDQLEPIRFAELKRYPWH